MKKILFYILSFTWGSIMTAIGCLATLGLLIAGHKPKKWGYCWYFEVGKGWGGVNLGPVFLVSKGSSVHTKNHEHGHGIQNCCLGPLMPLVVCLPSAARYWLTNMRLMGQKKNFSVALWAIAAIIGVALIVTGVFFTMTWLWILGVVMVVYFTILCYWLLFIETPKYLKGTVRYDDAWFEADATARGDKLMKELGVTNGYNQIHENKNER